MEQDLTKTFTTAFAPKTLHLIEECKARARSESKSELAINTIVLIAATLQEMLEMKMIFKKDPYKDTLLIETPFVIGSRGDHILLKTDETEFGVEVDVVFGKRNNTDLMFSERLAFIEANRNCIGKFPVSMFNTKEKILAFSKCLHEAFMHR